MDLQVSVTKALMGSSGKSAKELVHDLKLQGLSATKSEINSFLYSNKDLFAVDGQSPPLWRLSGNVMNRTSGESSAPRVRRTPTIKRAQELKPAQPPVKLYRWQEQALAAWTQQGKCGVVEAVTGTGKTRVGMTAVTRALGAGEQALVLVPTKELLYQWKSELEKLIPTSTIGLLGDGKTGSFAKVDVLVAIVNSARDPVKTKPRRKALLVADECHRYASTQNAKALSEAFYSRLGLTATYVSDESEGFPLLADYFGQVCFQMGYEQAIRDEVTAHFKVALVGVQFGGEQEAEEYEEAANTANGSRYWLISNGWAAKEPFGSYMKQVVALSNNKPEFRGKGDPGLAVKKSWNYLSAFAKQRKLLAESGSKIAAISEMSEAFRSADRSIVFTESIDAAESVAEELVACGLTASTVHAGQKAAERAAVLESFRSGDLKVIVAPRVLDEGVDVPAADLAVIVATSKTRRQMVQRMGRVLRRKADGRVARFAVLFIEGTTEDPDGGAHAEFLSEMTDFAEEVERFPWDSSDWHEVVAFLNDFRSVGPQPDAR